MLKYFSFLLILFLAQHASSQTIFPFRDGKNWFYVDSNFNRLTNQNFSFVEPFQGEVAIVEKNGKKGVINSQMKIIVQPQSLNIRIDQENSQLIVTNKEKTSIEYLDFSGKRIEGNRKQRICPSEYISSIYGFSLKYIGNKIQVFYSPQGYFQLQLGIKTHSDSIPGIYDAYGMCNTAIFLKKGSKWGAYNNFGIKKLDFIYDQIHPEILYDKLNYAIVKQDSLYGLVNDELELVTEVKYIKVDYMMNGFYLVTSPDGKKGYLDIRGREYFRD